MDRIKDFLIVIVLPMLVAMLIFSRCLPEDDERREVVSDTIHTTIVDTVYHYRPIVRDSVVVRYITEKLPVAADNNVASKIDSAEVVIPIEQKEYKDSTYHAWVSGYRVRLDSIRTYTQRDVVTIMQKEKPKRWHIGVTAGYGMTLCGMQPYVGIGITYSLFSL